MKIVIRLFCLIFIGSSIFFAFNFFNKKGGNNCTNTLSDSSLSMSINNDTSEEISSRGYKNTRLKTELLNYYMNFAFSSENQIGDATEYAIKMKTLVDEIDDIGLSKAFDESVSGGSKEEEVKKVIVFLTYLSKNIQDDLR